MEVIDPGHSYRVADLDGGPGQMIHFVKRFRGEMNHSGTTCQELLRVVIDRVRILDSEVSWPGNAEIIAHLQCAVAGFEARALLRKVEKAEIDVMDMEVSTEDGHWIYAAAPTQGDR